MATSAVSTGGVATQGSKTYVFGSSSGIDTSALVEVAYNQRKAEADKIDIKVKSNTTKSDAYGTLKSLSASVQNSLSTLRTTYGFSSTTIPVYDQRTGSLSSDSDTDPSRLVGVTIDPKTPLGSYNIEVVQKATANRIGSAPAASATTALGYNGSFTLGLGTTTGSAINVTSGMTLNDVAAAINASGSGVSASVVKISDASYQLVMTGSQTAKDITFNGISGDDVLENLGVTSGGTAANTLQASQQAMLKLDGVTITRDSNQIDDLITGVHISIKNAEPGTTLELNVEHDKSSLKSAVTKFVDAYNELRSFVITNQAVSSGGKVSEDAILFGDNYMKNLTQGIQSLISSRFGNSANGIDNLGAIGITLDGTNKLIVDEAKLDGAILSNFSDVQKLFSTQTTSNDTNFALLSNKSKLRSADLTFDIAMSGGVISGATVNGDATMFDVSGNSIVGKKGTVYEGMRFAYIGTDSTSVTFKIDQGFGDLLDNTLNDYTDAATGALKGEMDRLSSLNTDMMDRAASVRERAADFRDRLIEKYSRYESQIAQSKSVLTQLRAILGIKE